MLARRKGAKIRPSRRSMETVAADEPTVVVGVPPAPGGVRLDRPNQGPAAPEGSYLTVADFRPRREERL